MERRTRVLALWHGFVVTATKTGRGGTGRRLKSEVARVQLGGLFWLWTVLTSRLLGVAAKTELNAVLRAMTLLWTF
jgi:hypothetical protein